MTSLGAAVVKATSVSYCMMFDLVLLMKVKFPVVVRLSTVSGDGTVQRMHLLTISKEETNTNSHEVSPVLFIFCRGFRDRLGMF